MEQQQLIGCRCSASPDVTLLCPISSCSVTPPPPPPSTTTRLPQATPPSPHWLFDSLSCLPLLRVGGASPHSHPRGATRLRSGRTSPEAPERSTNMLLPPHQCISQRSTSCGHLKAAPVLTAPPPAPPPASTLGHISLTVPTIASAVNASQPFHLHKRAEIRTHTHTHTHLYSSILQPSSRRRYKGSLVCFSTSVRF